MKFWRKGAKARSWEGSVKAFRVGRNDLTRSFLCGFCVYAASIYSGPSSDARAGDWTYGGHAKYQYAYTDYRAGDLNAILGRDPARDHDVDLRLKAAGGRGPWDAAAHYELLAVHGDTLDGRRVAPLALPGVEAGSGLPDDRRRLFDLTGTITDRARTAAVHRLDRLSLGYAAGAHSIRVGRQALSWGNGLAFHPLDFVNPFSPIAIDKDYKTGDDMLFTQRALERGDVQAIVLPRRDLATRSVESGESTYAAKLRLHLRGFDVDIVGARHFDENLAGLGLVRSIGGAVWRFDALYADIKNGDGAWSFVTNLDYAWIWSGRNLYGYAEYFRNGVGETDPVRYVAPNAALAGRLARGELFTFARDYTALGVQAELHPLFNVFTNLIWNLNDGSAVLQVRGIYDWRQNVQLQAGVNLPYGDRGDEYGGIPLAGTGAFLSPGRSVYLRAAYYF